MDVTKLFEISFEPSDRIEPLPTAKLDAMIERASAYPQLQVPANQNPAWIRRAMAVAAAIVIAVTVSLQFMPAPFQEMNPTAETTTAAINNGDVYGDVSDLLMLETLNDLSDSTS